MAIRKTTFLSLGLALVVGFGCSSDSSNTGDDDDGFKPWELEELKPADGFSLRVPDFEVPSGHESQNCYFMRAPDLNAGQDYWVDRVLTALNPGSHHVTVFRVKTIVNLDPAKGTPVQLGSMQGTFIEGGDDYKANPCWDSANWADWPLVANSQHAKVDDYKTEWKLPDGVAMRFTPGEMLMLQTHYVNTSDQPTMYGARVGFNFYRYTKAQSPSELGTLFAFQTKIRICASNPTPTYSGQCKFPKPVTIAAANGHFHKRGQTFMMSPWDGVSTTRPATQFYKSANWDEPPMETALNVPLKAGGGIWYDCGFTWKAPSYVTCDDINAKDPMKANDCCYTFGGITDIGEHCNLFIYYYPKLEASDPITCNNQDAPVSD